MQEIPRIVIPRNYLIEIIPSAYGCRETRMEIVETLDNSVPILADLGHNGKNENNKK